MAIGAQKGETKEDIQVTKNMLKEFYVAEMDLKSIEQIYGIYPNKHE